MDLERINQIIDWFGRSDLTRFELTEGSTRLLLERPATQIASVPSVAPTRPSATPDQPNENTAVSKPEAAETAVKAPLYGICYLSSAPDKPPFVQVGQSVKSGDTLCLVEAMKVLNAIHAPCDGVVNAIVAPDGEEVEQGQTLVVLS